MDSTRVEDIMLSLAEYAVVPEDATLLEALRALDAAQARVPEGRQPHRAVLVRGRSGEIVGKLGHFAFLSALLPKRRALFDHDMARMSGLSDEMMASSTRTLSLLENDQVDLCERSSHVRVGDVCAPIAVHIESDASLPEAIRLFGEYRRLSLLVTRGGKTVGVLRVSDLFDELAGQMKSSRETR